MGRQKVECVDCFDGMRKLNNSSIDCIITSPPYNIGVDYANSEDTKSHSDYIHWMRSFLELCGLKLRDTGSVFLNLGGPVTTMLNIQEVLPKSMVIQNCMAWVKSIVVKDVAHGHIKPINSNRYLSRAFELIYHITWYGDVCLDKRSIGVRVTDKSNLKRYGNGQPYMRDAGNVWFIPYETVRREKNHPAAFPVELPMRCIKLVNPEVVLDPFCGSGSTGVACKRLGVDFLGFDISRDYCEHAERRIANEKVGSGL